MSAGADGAVAARVEVAPVDAIGRSPETGVVEAMAMKAGAQDRDSPCKSEENCELGEETVDSTRTHIVLHTSEVHIQVTSQLSN
jgi:hypothetical protein